MFPRLPRVRFFAVLYGVLGAGAAVYAAVYALDEEAGLSVGFAVAALIGVLLSGWYASEPDGVNDPKQPSPNTGYEYLLFLLVVAVTALGFGMLVPRL